MKPHQLRIEAFGPYAGLTAISFDSLSDEGLFLIHGSTGAGKTFLLDALCFALYGEVSGDRSLRSLKSDHAAPSAVPRVALEFSCAGSRFLVERSPAHTAPKSRGTGFTEKAAQAVLVRITPAGREPIASRSSEVTREVERLVGLTAGQFRQVILLPQGKFAEVLRARAEEREALLKTLFDTVLFEQAGSWLEDRARTARLELAERNRTQEGLRRQVAQVWRTIAPPEVVASTAGTAPEAATAPEPSPELDPDQVLAPMAAHLQAATERLQRATAALEAAQAARTAIDRQAERWDRRAAAAARLQELEGKQAVVTEFRERLKLAERAEQLRASLEAQAAAQGGMEQQQRQLMALLASASRARQAALALPDAVVALALGACPASEELAEARSALAARRVEVTALARRAEEGARAREAAAAASRLERQAQAAITAAEAALEARRLQRQQDSGALQRASQARDRLDGLEQAAVQARERAQAAAALQGADRRLAQAQAGQEGADAAVQHAETALAQLRQHQIAGMASQLAAGLAAGDPCPVCGSSHHPSPAQARAAPITEAAVEAAEAAVRAAGVRARQAAADRATAQAEQKALLERAGAAAQDPATAHAASRTADQALQEARSLAKAASSLEAAIQAHDRELEALQSTRQAAATEQALQAQVAAAAQAQVQELAAECSAALGAGVDPQAVLRGLQPLDLALKELAGGAEAITATATRLEQATERFNRELAASGFSDGPAVRQALKEPAWRQELAGRIEAFERSLIAVRAQLASPDLADVPTDRPDTEAAQAAVIQADAARTGAVERQTEARSAHAEIERLAAEHRQGAGELAKQQEQARLLHAVADRCQGRSAPFISLQRWVLSAYLAEICRYANQRLELMTSGRYQLRLTDEGGRGGRQAGLGLRVLDAYTGEERGGGSSLSGGETFQASLALALGVADTVQAHSGGVHLEALFIDEGFGTLDPDTLQLAMDELDRLRDGERMVGVISHVGALKERIRAGILITASEVGSTATVCRTVLG